MFFGFLSLRWTQDDSSATSNYFSFCRFFSRIGFIDLHSWVHNKMCFLLRLSYTQGLTIPCLAHCCSVKETLPPKPFSTLIASKKTAMLLCNKKHIFLYLTKNTNIRMWVESKQKKTPNTFIDNWRPSSMRNVWNKCKNTNICTMTFSRLLQVCWSNLYEILCLCSIRLLSVAALKKWLRETRFLQTHTHTHSEGQCDGKGRTS